MRNALPAVALFLAAASALAEPVPCWSVRENGALGLTIEVDVAEPVVLGAGGGLGFEAEGFPSSIRADGAFLPALALPVALPPEGEVTVRATIEGLHPVAVAAPAGESDPGAGALDAGRESVDPSGFVGRGRVSWAADLRVLPLRVFAVRRGPDGQWQAPRRVRIECAFAVARASGASAARVAVPEGAQAAGRGMSFDAAVNAAQAGAWRAVPVARGRTGRGDGFGSAANPWLRLGVERRGLYVITATDLESVGIQPEDVGLAGLRLFCGPAGALPESVDVGELPDWMDPCALLVEDDGDGRWDAATRVYFVGNGPDGWCADLDREPASPDDRHYTHPYADRFTYWFTWDGAFSTAPLWIESADAAPGAGPRQTIALGRVHHEPNEVHDARPRQDGLEWPRFFAKEVAAGPSDIGAGVLVTLPGLASGPAAVRAAVWGQSWGVSGLANDHHALIRVGADTLGSAWWDGIGRRIIAGEVASPLPTSLVALYAPVRYDAGDEVVNDRIALDWVEVDYPLQLQAAADSLEFWVPPVAGDPPAYRLTGLTDADGWLLLDAGSPLRPRRLLPSVVADGDGFAAEFALGASPEAAHLVLAPRGRAARPAAIEAVSPERIWLRDRTDAVDYVILTSAELSAPAQQLANHRTYTFHGAAGDTLLLGRVAVVDVREVFDEFAWGQHDPTALRNLLVHARRSWTGGEPVPPLSHVLLLGDAYYDARGYRPGGGRDLVPSHLWYDRSVATSSAWSPEFYGDEWFGLLDGPEDGLVDLSVGRLPAASAAQATAMVEKIVAAETRPPLDAWKTRLIFAADDICQGNDQPDGLGFLHMRQSERLCAEAAPADGQIRKLYLYEYGSECRFETKPDATRDLKEALEEGALLLNFVGHGSESQLASERLLQASDVGTLRNAGRPFLMITASCAVGRFAQGGDGLGVQALRLAGGGAFAVVSASATAGSTENFELNRLLLQQVFPERRLSGSRALGFSLVRAKWLNEPDYGNDRRYNLLGDPGARLPVPEGRVALRLEGVPRVPADSDTLLRGAPATLRGSVLDAEGAPATTFAGSAEVLILDTDRRREPTESASDDYRLPGARIYSGRVAVAHGEFECPFVVPWALLTGATEPSARIYIHARRSGATGVTDAAGARVRLAIPEEVWANPSDTLGPTIDLRWKVPGEAVHAGSVAAASLWDSSGIYVAALAPSRSVVASISDRSGRKIEAQDLADAVSFGADYRAATVEYELPATLPVGEPLTLTISAWDNLGSQSSDSLSFQIGESVGPARLLQAVYCIPNPTAGQTRFLFDIAREAELAVTIYTVTGRRIRELSPGYVLPVRAREVGLAWNGRDADGASVANGLYFFRAVARDAAGQREERIDRLVVLR